MSSWFTKSNWRRVASGPAGVLRWPKYAGELLWELRCGRRPIYIDYPPQVKPRYGYGSPPHAGLYALMSGQLIQFSSVITALGEYAQDLARISAEQPQSGLEPFWRNGWFGGLNAATLYFFIRKHRPKTYLEVGSGNSTKFARRAIEDGCTGTRIISIDPAPRVEIDGICDVMIRAPLEDTDLSTFDQVEEGDIVVIDNSHRCLPNSDVTVFFLEVLPRLRAGVLVYIDDVFLPFDYPPDWSRRYYSEQYLLAAILLAGQTRVEIVLPCTFAQHDPHLAVLVGEFWSKIAIPAPTGYTKGIWLRTI